MISYDFVYIFISRIASTKEDNPTLFDDLTRTISPFRRIFSKSEIISILYKYFFWKYSISFDKLISIYILVFSGTKAFIILILFFQIQSKDTKLTNKEPIRKTEEVLYNSNIIKDINYTSRDLKGNEYILVAKEGEIDLDNSDIIFLTDVTAYIKLVKNSELIVITSNYGKYNTINYDTIFSKNVKIDYVDNIITGDYLDFSMMKNLLIISRNVVYKNLENTMKADVIELDTTTKDTKIFMHEGDARVNITNKN